jgi:hypothetical protein
MADQKSSIEMVGATYLALGGITASLSMLSTSIYFALGPGAFWNIGFVPWILGWVFGIFGSILRMVTWPYGLYVLINNPDAFFPWLFYHWY